MPDLFLRLDTGTQLAGALQGREVAEHKRNHAGQSFAGSVRPSASRSADVYRADSAAPGHHQHMAYSCPVLPGSDSISPPVSAEVSGRRGAEKQGGRAQDKRV